MSGNQRIVCPHCDAINRVALDRMGDAPTCGACKQALVTGEPLELSTRNFDRHIGNSDWPVLVDFWAPWCGPCRTMGPVIHEAAEKLGTRLRVAKLNTETETDIANRLGIRSIPTLIVFRQGKIVGQRAGAIDLPTLMAWVSTTLA